MGMITIPEMHRPGRAEDLPKEDLDDKAAKKHGSGWPSGRFPIMLSLLLREEKSVDV